MKLMYSCKYTLEFSFLISESKKENSCLRRTLNKRLEDGNKSSDLKKIFKIDSMSNDEECDDGFITRPPPRQSDTWRTLWRVAVIQDIQCDGRYNNPCLQ